MEDILTTIQKDAVAPKFAPLRKSCAETLDLLRDEQFTKSAEPYQLRERCLCPLQLALESKNSRLAAYGIGGIQRMLVDERFQSTMECEEEDRWLPMQVLNAVWTTPNMDEYTQVEIMKVLLNMTFTTAWCMNARVITKIAELCFATFLSTETVSLRSAIVNTLTRIIGLFYHRQLVRQNSDPFPQSKVSIETFATTSQTSVRTAVKATLTQLLTAITEKLREKEKLREEDTNSAIAEFTSNASGEAQSLTADIVSILRFLCGKLTVAEKYNSNRQTEPLLLEGIYSILLNLPGSTKENQEFVDLIWQHLCPSLISLLGNPVTDKNITQRLSSTQEQMGRGGGCSSSAPSVTSSSAKTIYNIAVQLVRLVGNLRSLRPVLESVFHRMLLYPPPVHRLDALKTVHEALKTPEKLLNLAGPTIPDKQSKLAPGNMKRRHNSDIALLKLIVDAIQECCHCNDSSVCITSVNIIQDLMSSVEKLVKGEGLSDVMIAEIHKQYREVEGYHVINDQLEPMSPDHGESGTYFVHPSPSRDVGDRISRDAENDYDSSDSDAEEEQIQVTENGHVMRYCSPDESTKTVDKTDAHTNSEHCETEKEEHKPSLISKGLHDKDEVEKTFGHRADFDEIERQGAKDFIQSLLTFLPRVLQCYSMAEVDELILQFSSDVCTEIAEKHSEDNSASPILNADGVYVATYSALLLNLKLIRCGYFASEEKSVPVSEQQFIDGILGTGLLLYLSPTWLSELYFQFISRNILEMAGYVDDKDDGSVPLIQLLSDIDGLESRKVGGQLMYFARDTESQGSEPMLGVDLGEYNPAVAAGMKFARRVLMVCWDGVLDVLSVLVSGKSSCGITSSLSILLGMKEESRRAREAICTSLDGLQKAARLSSILGLQDRCGAVFQQLAAASCEIEDLKKEERKSGKPLVTLPSSRPKLARLHAAHALSMDVVLSIGLEMGSHAEDCWKHVFRCCTHIAELEHTYFSMGNNQSSLPKVQNELGAIQQVNRTSLDLDDSELYSTMMLTAEPVAPSIDVPELIKQSSLESGWDSAISGGGVLNATQAAKVLCGLSQQVDRLFEDAASKLNMKAMVSFLTELCKSSQQQLSQYGRPGPDVVGAGGAVIGGVIPGHMPVTALHLYRLGDIMLKSLQSERPLLHIMRAWSIVAPHFVEAACHHDSNISKKAVHCIHEFVTTLLTRYQELPHCHFNESLCKPFENLLCLELCDGDVQDQIVCSICELVEACASDIKSGWRPLFGALRAVKIEFTTSEEVNEARQRHVAAVLDVFNVFLNTDNVLVFANAAVDCILCLLKYVRGPGEFEEVEEDDSDSGSEFVSGTAAEDLCLPALKYLQQCCSILSSMWKMPACPIFSGAHRIKMTSKPKCVDPIIPNMDLETFQKPFLEKKQQQEFQRDTISPPPHQAPDCKSINSIDSGIGVLNPDGSISATTSPNMECPSIKSEPKSSPVTSPHHNRAVWNARHAGMWTYDPVTLGELDNHTGVLHVWFLALEGLANTVSTCPKNYQPQTLEMLFDLLRSAAQTPGPDFSMHCMNHLVLPMLQAWLRRGNQITRYWDSATANFKQCCGLCTDLVVEYIIQFANVPESQPSVEFMLKQLLEVLIECIAQPNEAMSRLGCACIKHCLLSTGPLLTEQMWYAMVVSIQHAFDVTLYCLRQLMTPFHADSDNFYGDIGNVRVAVRKDCSGIECERLRQLAQQVFLLDSQKGTAQVIDYEREEDRSYIFLIYPPDHEHSNNLDHIVTRVPFRSVVVGLLSHQILVQMVGMLLLQGTPHLAPAEKNILPSEGETSPVIENKEDKDLIQDVPLPGMLRFMSARTVKTLLACLDTSVHVAVDFDARPGLKFLIQKVARAEVAANLYKQAGISCTFLIHALLEICSHQDNICLDNTHKMICGGNNETYELEEEKASTSPEPIQRHIAVFARQLKAIFDQVCTWYVDLYLDREGPHKADWLASQALVFLLAEPEELPKLKRDRSLQEMVKEKLQQRQEMMTSGGGAMMVEAVSVQGDEFGDSHPEGDEPPPHTSPFNSPKKENKHKPDPTDKIYAVVSEKKINDLMSEYKKRKQTHSMPMFVKATRSKPAPSKKNKPISTDPVDQEIDEQQKESIMKDSEANLQSWIEMICGVLHLYHQLPDYRYQALLPLIFNCVNQLICHCRDQHLRETLARWTYRIGHLYGIAPSGGEPPVASPT